MGLRHKEKKTLMGKTRQMDIARALVTLQKDNNCGCKFRTYLGTTQYTELK